MTGGPYDPRAVANLMLNEADRSGIKVTNLALQKLLYFAHSIFLIEAKRPLVSGYFEAWQYGPVHPAAYSAFKTAGSSPIDFRATGQNVMTGERHALDLPEDPAIRRHLARIMSSYGQLSPGRLVDISHAKGAPWDYIADKGRTSVALGLRIPDDVIVNRFKFHKVSIGAAPVAGEPDEDTRLPEIDLARIAPLPTDQKRRALERFKLGYPTITYKPVRSRFADIFNVQPDMFAVADPTAWPVLERLIRAKATSDEECSANLLVAKGLHDFARSNALRSRSQTFFPLSLSVGEKVEYWLPMVTALEGAPLLIFIDPRRGKKLTADARRFVFSMMHEHIRMANPDFSTARLGIVQFGDAADDQRPVKLSTDEGVELFSFDQLDLMVRETYDIWREVSEEREDEVRRKAAGGGHGPLFDQ